MSNGWKADGLELTPEMLAPEKIRRTVAKVERFYHPDCTETKDAALDWFYNEITL
jgi:hypothetical protein